MTADIRRLLNELGYAIAGDRIEVMLPGGRKQVLMIAEKDGRVRLRTVVVSARAAEYVEAGPLRLMLINRQTELVDFAIDGRRRWIGETVMPAGSVSRDELFAHVRALAIAADQLERVMTGMDAH